MRWCLTFLFVLLSALSGVHAAEGTDYQYANGFFQNTEYRDANLTDSQADDIAKKFAASSLMQECYVRNIKQEGGSTIIEGFMFSFVPPAPELIEDNGENIKEQCTTWSDGGYIVFYQLRTKEKVTLHVKADNTAMFCGKVVSATAEKITDQIPSVSIPAYNGIKMIFKYRSGWIFRVTIDVDRIVERPAIKRMSPEKDGVPEYSSVDPLDSASPEIEVLTKRYKDAEKKVGSLYEMKRQSGTSKIDPENRRQAEDAFQKAGAERTALDQQISIAKLKYVLGIK